MNKFFFIAIFVSSVIMTSCGTTNTMRGAQCPSRGERSHGPRGMFGMIEKDSLKLPSYIISNQTKEYFAGKTETSVPGADTNYQHNTGMSLTEQ